MVREKELGSFDLFPLTHNTLGVGEREILAASKELHLSDWVFILFRLWDFKFQMSGVLNIKA